MKTLDLTHLGGLKFTQNVLKHMQDSYLDGFAALAALLGNNAIVSGVQVSGGGVSAGWVILNGELLPFEAGGATAWVDVVETVETREYDDTTTKDFVTTRVAKCVAGPGTAFSLLKPASIVPAGVIMMWAGSIASIPAGWALCDGTHGTPNLRGKFVVGYDVTDSDYDAVGEMGGSTRVTLQPEEMPRHSHGINLFKNDSAGGPQPNTGYLQNDNGAALASITTQLTGGDSFGITLGHENRPPYYVLAYIQKL